MPKAITKVIFAGFGIWAVLVTLLILIAMQVKTFHDTEKEKKKFGKIKDSPEGVFRFHRITTYTPEGYEKISDVHGRLEIDTSDGFYWLHADGGDVRFRITSRGQRIEPGKYYFIARCEETGTNSSITEMFYMDRLIQVSIRTRGFLQVFE